MEIQYPIPNPHAIPADEILQQLETNAANGLSKTEAEQRSKKFGPNVYSSKKEKSTWMMLILQFKSPIVYLLLFATAVSVFFKNYIDAIAILVVILINALIGFLMELQARSSMKALKEMDVMHSKVLRDHKTEEIPSEQIVPGDIVILEAGQVIPADGRLVETNHLQCDESSLTGESMPVEKNTASVSKDKAAADQQGMVFKGTSVTSGRGKAVITGIGENTQLGTITSLVEKSGKEETPLNKRIAVLGKRLIWVTLGLTFIFALTGILQGKNWVVILETSIALSVAAFPEGLPIVSTIALAYGMLLMAKRNAIVKNLPSVETLGSTNIILTDKTGTLTENKIHVDTLAFPDGKIKVQIKNDTAETGKEKPGKHTESFQKLVLTGVLCNNAPGGETGKPSGDPIEIALMQWAAAAGIETEGLKKEYERTAEIPFSAETKMMATLHKGGNGSFVAAKGSVEAILENCSNILSEKDSSTINEATKKKILEESEQLASEGLRVLAFAFKEGNAINRQNILNGLTYIAMIGFLDPPRLDVKDAILSCRQAGIRVVMITGDHPMTALNIAKKVGLADEKEPQVMTGSELPTPGQNDKSSTEKILSTTVFARTTPKQKLEIVSICQEAGNIVAMTGDGVNDAPALKKADIGIAMGKRGTQVAKETADMVLKDDSFKSIAKAVAQGRDIFDNIRKFIIYLVSCNLSEICIVTLLGFIAPATTLLALQILYLNMITDIFPALALGLGRGDKNVMKQPPKKPDENIIAGKNWIAVALYAALITLTVLGAVLYSKFVLHAADNVSNDVAFITLAFAQLFHVFNMPAMNSGMFINDITKNKFVWMALFLCFGLMVGVYFIPSLRGVLGLEKLSFIYWAVSIVASLVPLVAVQSFKLIKKIADRASTRKRE